MKYIKTQELFSFFKKKGLNNNIESPADKHLRVVKNFLKNNDFKINDDMSVDVFGNFSYGQYNYNKLRELPIKFNIAHGNFSVAYQELLSLRLCPVEVKGNFDCSANNLANLIGAPIRVDGYFSVESKGHLEDSILALKTLEGCPRFIGGNLNIRGNWIYSFDYFPDSLGGRFICDYNPIYYIWMLFEDKNKVDVFNDYDPIKPPIKGDAYSSYINNKPRLYLDVLELFLDNEGISFDIDIESFVKRILIYYNVIGMDNSKKTDIDIMDMLRKFIK